MEPGHPGAVWGERAAGGFFEDIHVLIVVVLGMSILLGSLASAYTTYQASQEAAALRGEASRILRAVVGDRALIHGDERGLFELDSLMRLNASILSSIAGAHGPVQLVIAERSGDAPQRFQVETASLGPDRTSASTAAAVWHSDLDVRAARITVTVAG